MEVVLICPALRAKRTDGANGLPETTQLLPGSFQGLDARRNERFLAVSSLGVLLGVMLGVFRTRNVLRICVQSLNVFRFSTLSDCLLTSR